MQQMRAEARASCENVTDARPRRARRRRHHDRARPPERAMPSTRHRAGAGRRVPRLRGDAAARVAVLWGANGTFCAGADLKATASGRTLRREPEATADGPSRMLLSKPTIAASPAMRWRAARAGALVRPARAGRGRRARVFCRRWGVPLIDGGTVGCAADRLSRALDLISRVARRCREAERIGLANRVVPRGQRVRRPRRWPPRSPRSHRAACSATAARPTRVTASRSSGAAPRVRAGPSDDRLGREPRGRARFAAGAGRHGLFERGAPTWPHTPQRSSAPAKPGAPL